MVKTHVNMSILLFCLMYDPGVVTTPRTGDEVITQTGVRQMLEKEFDEADRLGRTNTEIGMLQGTPGEGTSSVGDLAIQFLQKLWLNSPELPKVITKLQRSMERGKQTVKEGGDTIRTTHDIDQQIGEEEMEIPVINLEEKTGVQQAVGRRDHTPTEED